MNTAIAIGVAAALAWSMGACKRSEEPSKGTEPPASASAATSLSEPALEAPRQPKAKGTGATMGTAELVLSGEINQELKGSIVTCGYTRLEGRDQGGTWALRTDDFDFQIMATGDVDFANPVAILNAKKPKRISYVFKRKAGKVTAASDRTVAEIDAELQNVVGKEKVHVKGRMTCPPK
jgi:hypothetical protein